MRGGAILKSQGWARANWACRRRGAGLNYVGFCAYQIMDASNPPVWQSLRGEVVVLDLASPFLYVGKLVEQRHDFVLLEDADAHDLRDTTTTREQYVLHCRQFGPTPNRRQAWVSLRDVVGVSRLADVILD